jgi:hypothetical protein
MSSNDFDGPQIRSILYVVAVKMAPPLQKQKVTGRRPPVFTGKKGQNGKVHLSRNVLNIQGLDLLSSAATTNRCDFIVTRKA